MIATCFCGKHRLDTESATYVRDGHPLCSEFTCDDRQRQAMNSQQIEDMRRREIATRMIGAGFNGT